MPRSTGGAFVPATRVGAVCALSVTARVESGLVACASPLSPPQPVMVRAVHANRASNLDVINLVVAKKGPAVYSLSAVEQGAFRAYPSVSCLGRRKMTRFNDKKAENFVLGGRDRGDSAAHPGRSARGRVAAALR